MRMRSEWSCEFCGASFVRPGGTPYTYCSNACQTKSNAARNRRTTDEKFWSKVQRAGGDGCWVWTGATDANGKCSRGVFNTGNRVARAPRVSWELTYGPIRDGAWVLHSCDNALCVRPDHLHLGNAQDNSREMVERGRSARGERHSQSVLSEDTVREMRRRRAAGERMTDIARAFNIHYQTCVCAIKRINYRYVE